MVRPPSVEEEDRRRIGRERKVLMTERTRHSNGIKGLLFAQGITGYEPIRRDRRDRLDRLRTGDGRELVPHIKAQILRELDRLELLIEQIKIIEAERNALIAARAAAAPAAMLLNFKGIGPEFATTLHSEGWFRQFNKRRQVTAYAGLPPSLRQSGSVRHEQGVSKAGNARLRTAMAELSWLWLRNQPNWLLLGVLILNLQASNIRLPTS
jgi:transposase